MANWSYDPSYRQTSPFGPRVHPVTGKPHFHTGIDLVKSFRASIYAFVGGEVVHAREGKAGTGFGNMGIVVAVRDKNGSLHCYVHLDGVSVKVGETVKQGQEIGKQGNTGKFSTGSHLHYEVRKKAAPSFGWIESEKDRCHEPTKYLVDYYAKEQKEVKPKMSADDANKIINFLQAAYKSTTDPEARTEFHRLANELRKASGQPLQ